MFRYKVGKELFARNLRPSNKHIVFLDLLRIVCILLIVGMHYGQNSIPFNLEPFHHLISKFTYGVSFFVFLSGTVLSYNYQGKKLPWITFIRHRLARIYPLYLLAFIITLLFGMYRYGSYPKGFSVILQLFHMHSWYPGIVLEINYVTWAISVLMFCYALFPWFTSIQNKISSKHFALFVIVIWCISSALHFTFHTVLVNVEFYGKEHFIQCLPPWHLNAFLFGMACGKSLKDGGLNLHPIFSIIAILLIVGLSFSPIVDYAHNGLFAPLFALTILSANRLNFSDNKLQKLVADWANISLALYLFQYPIFMLFFEDQFSTSQFYIFLLVLHLVAWLVTSKFDAPIQRWLRVRYQK